MIAVVSSPDAAHLCRAATDTDAADDDGGCAALAGDSEHDAPASLLRWQAHPAATPRSYKNQKIGN